MINQVEHKLLIIHADINILQLCVIDTLPATKRRAQFLKDLLFIARKTMKAIKTFNALETVEQGLLNDCLKRHEHELEETP